jgi:predicted nucleotidyltransferase
MSSERLRRLSLPVRIEHAILEFVVRVRMLYPDAEVYLFGSYARGTWVEDSDIDVIVVSRYLERLSFYERGSVLRKLADQRIPFSILAYTPQEFEIARKKSIVVQDASDYWVKLT